MDARKVTRFKLDNGEWRSKVYILNPDTNKHEEEIKDKYAGWYNTNKYESYIHYLMGIEKEKPKPTENKTLFNRKINVSWGKLQTELNNKNQQFAAEAQKYSPEKLIDTLNNKNATKNIERLSEMSREEVKAEYKLTNYAALSNDDNIQDRVNNAFLKGEGLEDITINDKTYQGLLFDEYSQQSQRLKENGTFKTYYDNYLSCIKELIREANDAKEVNIEAISKKLSSKVSKPNFSDYLEFYNYDYYGLMGGTQNIDFDFEVTPTQNGEYNIKTTMYINDWYGADKDDINKHTDFKDMLKNIGGTLLTSNPMDNLIIPTIYYNEFDSNKKRFIPGLDDFFWLQHHYDCKPFPTQIIYKSEDRIIFGN